MVQPRDDSVWSSADIHGLADVVAGFTPAEQSPDLLDQLDALERLKSAAAAAQAAISSAFADAAEAEDAQTGGRRRPPRAMSIGAEVAFAVRSSPHAGEQRVMLSRRLRDELPEALAALGRGELNEDRAFAIARGVAHLTRDQRGEVDADLAGRVAGLGDEKLRQAVRRSCLTVAADAEDRRFRRARAERHVTTRQLDDGTGRLTAILTAEQLATMRGALDEAAAAARSAGDERTGGQVRADTLVARVTGQDSASPVPVRVNLVVGLESLFGAAREPGHVPGEGGLPAGVCVSWVREASAAAKACLRRLFVTPKTGELVSMDSSSRTFSGQLAEFLNLRDGGLCRTPGCNALIRHRDHIQSVVEGGTTNAHNGQGLCERCNYVKESPGWASWVASEPGEGLHEVHGVTEHLRIVRSTAPPMPLGTGVVEFTAMELRLAHTYMRAG